MAKHTLQEQQTTLGLYLRDPVNNAPPAEMALARVEVYRDLIFQNLSTLLSGTFAVLIKILGDDQWRLLVRIFLRDHRAKTPKFGEIAQEFVEFLANEPNALKPGAWPPFMVELAHYEWVEMVLQQSDSEPLPSGSADNLLQQSLLISPLAWPLAYAWPVHLVGADFQPQTPPAQPTLLLVRRAEDWSVQFSELSPLAWRLLQRIADLPELNGGEQLEGLAREAGAIGSPDFIENGAQLLRQMHAQGVVSVA